MERKRLLTHLLWLWKERGNDIQAARTLIYLCDTNRRTGPSKEGVPQGKEASEVFERLGHAGVQTRCLVILVSSLRDDNQLGVAEKAVSCAIELLPQKGQQLGTCQAHHVLGDIYRILR